jgi:Tol biopolymer transport system component
VRALAAVGVVSLGALGLLADSGPAQRATFPGQNGLIAYTLSQLYVVNADGTGKRAVTVSTPQRPVRAFQPAFAPDGIRIVFGNSVGTSAGGGLWIINSDGTGGARIPNTQQNDTWPTFSPDGRQVGFVRHDGRFNSLWVINVDGTGLRQVTTGITVEDPEWSPDGTRFAFSGGPASDLYVVNQDGTGLTNLTAAEFSNAAYPSWSPDGSRIAYSGFRQLRTIAPTGGASTVVVSGLSELWEPAWSPDGTQLALAYDPGTNPNVQEEIYVVNADGSNLHAINADSETTVTWGKLAAVPPPVAGVSVNVAPVSGTVRVRVRGTNRFVSLARLRNVPVGSELDVTRGRVRLVSAAGAGRTQSGVFYQGRGIVQQPRARTPVTTLVVSGPLACPRRRPANVDAAAPPRRRLWGNANGRFTTKGRYASAAVRGTIWLTEDRCDGTLIRVTRGTVTVRDLVARRTVTVRAGRSYLARAPR